MTKDKALRLALEALSPDPYRSEWAVEEDKCKAITAIKAALEAKDEPVVCKECHLKDTVYDLLDDLKVANLKLSVRSQRTWVGLTEKDICEAAVKSQEGISPRDDTLRFAIAIEAKLKEKNT